MPNLDFQKLKKFLIEKEDKIILFIGFFLVAFLSFGAGKVSEISRPATPIIFQDPAGCQNSAILSEGQSLVSGEAGNPETQGQIIGNKNSKIYHLPGGAFYDKISLANRVYFNSEADAQKAGYRKAKN